MEPELEPKNWEVWAFARMKTFWIKMPEKKSEDQGLTEPGDADTTEAPPKETT